MLKITLLNSQKNYGPDNQLRDDNLQTLSVQFSQKEELEVIQIFQDQKNIGIVDSQGYYYNTNALLSGKICERIKQKSQGIFLNPTLQSLSFQVKIIACGQQFIIILTETGKLYGQGRNDKGQLGQQGNNQRTTCVLINQIASHNIVQITCGMAHCLALTHDGQLFSWGDGSKGQLLPGKNLQGGGKVLPVIFDNNLQILQIQCGRYSSSFLNGDFEIVRWGEDIVNETKRLHLYDLIIIHHQISWSLQYQAVVYTCFRLPKNEQLASSLKKRLRKASYKVACKGYIGTTYKIFEQIERISQELTMVRL